MLQEAVVVVVLAGTVMPGHRYGQQCCLWVRRYRLMHRAGIIVRRGRGHWRPGCRIARGAPRARRHAPVSAPGADLQVWSAAVRVHTLA